jgi:hypothetical protein
MAMPAIPSITGGAAGPSSAADTGNTGGLGGMTIGDYYESGARVRKDNGLGWQEFAVVGAVAVLGLLVWKKL